MSSPAPASPPPHVHVSVRAAVREAVEAAWAAAVRSGALPPVPVDAEVPIVEVSHTSDPAHGDVASSLALKLARPLRRPPMAIAEAIAAELRDGIGAGGPLADVQVAAPGFLNMRLAAAYLERTLDAARAAGDAVRTSAPGDAPQDRRGVRVREPDRSADGRQRPRRLRG